MWYRSVEVDVPENSEVVGSRAVAPQAAAPQQASGEVGRGAGEEGAPAGLRTPCADCEVDFEGAVGPPFFAHERVPWQGTAEPRRPRTQAPAQSGRGARRRVRRSRLRKRGPPFRPQSRPRRCSATPVGERTTTQRREAASRAPSARPHRHLSSPRRPSTVMA